MQFYSYNIDTNIRLCLWRGNDDSCSKLVAKPIKVLSIMDTKGNITPLRFKMETEDESYQVIKIDKVINRTNETFAGNNMIIFNCQSIIDNIKKRYEI